MLRQLTSTNHQSVLGRLLRLPLRLVPAATVVRIPTGLNKGFRWVCGSSIQRCWFGTYEFEKQDFVARVVKPGMTVWDIGANVGFYTLAFARLVGPEGLVIAFEPLAANVQHLLRHLEINAIGHVKVVQAALSHATELLGFTATRTSSQGSLAGVDQPYLVPTITPQSVLETLPKAIPQLLKIDIEGAEGAVLSAARPLLAEHGPDILLALHGAEQETLCTRILREAGYRLFYLDGTDVANEGPLASDEIFATRRETSVDAVTRTS